MIEPDDHAVRALYRSLIDGSNAGDAEAMTAGFADDAQMIGFDGSEIAGRDRAREYLASIFADHKVASFVTLVRDVHVIAPGVVLLRAHAGMLPPGEPAIKPERNAVQTLVAVRRGDAWQVALFQNTPAAWHGREDDAAALTAELQAAADKVRAT